MAASVPPAPTPGGRYAPGMGLRKDREDRRDRRLFATTPNIDAMPDKADTTPILPPLLDKVGNPTPITDQRTSSACTGYSGAITLHAVMVKDGHRDPFVPSPVFLYREARVLGGYLEEDLGAELRFIWKAANKLGLPPLSNIKPRFGPGQDADPRTGIFPETSIWRRPVAPSHYRDAERRQALTYFRVDTLNDLLQSLADGWPVNIGVEVFRSWYGWGGPKFNIPDPAPNESGIGGHAITAIGYDKPSRRIVCRNQWGISAHEGKPDFTISFNYFVAHSWDNWTARLIEGGRVA